MPTARGLAARGNAAAADLFCPPAKETIHLLPREMLCPEVWKRSKQATGSEPVDARFREAQLLAQLFERVGKFSRSVLGRLGGGGGGNGGSNGGGNCGGGGNAGSATRGSERERHGSLSLPTLPVILPWGSRPRAGQPSKRRRSWSV